MSLNENGKIADQCWCAIPDHFPDVQLDEYIVMPNHIHGIICIRENMVIGHHSVGIQDFDPLRNDDQSQRYKKHRTINQYQHIIPRSIGSIIRGFKTGVTKLIRQMNPEMVVWQRNYYDRIIRDEHELHAVRKYIRNNPVNWAYDEHYRSVVQNS